VDLLFEALRIASNSIGRARHLAVGKPPPALVDDAAEGAGAGVDARVKNFPKFAGSGKPGRRVMVATGSSVGAAVRI